MGDYHALARSESIGLYYEGSAEQRQGLLNLPSRIADRVVGGRDMHPVHELFGESLAGFEMRGFLRGTKNGKTTALKLVDHSQTQREFGANDRQIRFELVGKLHQ